MKRTLPDLTLRPAAQRTLNDEELELWRKEAGGEKTSPASAPEERAAAPPSRKKKTSPASGESSSTAERWAGMDRRTARRLRRGKPAIEARLDLHGMTQAQAHAALVAFIERSASGGKRMLLVITGKGGRLRDGSHGVLREALPKWLAAPALRSHILAVTPARPKDGGSGACYVYLRRR